MNKEKHIFSGSLNDLQEPYFYGYLEEAIEKGYEKILIDVKYMTKVGKFYEHAWYNEDGSYRFVNGARLLNAPDVSGNFISIVDFKRGLRNHEN